MGVGMLGISLIELAGALDPISLGDVVLAAAKGQIIIALGGAAGVVFVLDLIFGNDNSGDNQTSDRLQSKSDLIVVPPEILFALARSRSSAHQGTQRTDFLEEDERKSPHQPRSTRAARRRC